MMMSCLPISDHCNNTTLEKSHRTVGEKVDLLLVKRDMNSVMTRFSI